MNSDLMDLLPSLEYIITEESLSYTRFHVLFLVPISNISLSLKYFTFHICIIKHSTALDNTAFRSFPLLSSRHL